MATRKRVLRTLAGTAPDSRRSVPPPTAKVEPPPASLVIVGIGASAGGLEAIEQFLAHTPLHQDLALVVVQHLGPEQKDLLVELLQRKTQMTVQQVVDGTRVEPDHVYVIPPGKELSILHGTLHLLDPLEPRGLRLPIDAFFRALADDLREASIGVVLSGMGSDGTLGLRAIKEHGGLTMVQEPGSAAFDGMPKSAIATGVADVVAPPTSWPCAWSPPRCTPAASGSRSSASTSRPPAGFPSCWSCCGRAAATTSPGTRRARYSVASSGG